MPPLSPVPLYHKIFKKARGKEEIATAYVKKTNNPNMGRPSVNPRNNDLRVRLSDAEEEMLQKILRQTGRSKTEIVVKGIALVYKELQKQK